MMHRSSLHCASSAPPVRWIAVGLETARCRFTDFILKLMELRAALLEDAVVPEAAFFQHVGGALEVCGDIVRIVGVGAYGDDFPAQFPISLQHIHAGVEIPHPLFDSSGVQRDAFPLV